MKYWLKHFCSWFCGYTWWGKYFILFVFNNMIRKGNSEIEFSYGIISIVRLSESELMALALVTAWWLWEGELWWPAFHIVRAKQLFFESTNSSSDWSAVYLNVSSEFFVSSLLSQAPCLVISLKHIKETFVKMYKTKKTND